MENRIIKKQQEINKKLEKNLKNKKKIKVAFFVIHSSVWKYDSIFKYMESNEKYDPIIIICPYIMYGKTRMLSDMSISEMYFKNKGYNYLNTYNQKYDEWLDVKKVFNPDIIFYTNPYKNLTRDEYYIYNFSNVLSCYADYAFSISDDYEMTHDLVFHNLLWKKFEETENHLQMARVASRIKGKNSIATGYVGTECLLNKSLENTKVWKSTDKNLKKIIWAPHHTLDKDGEFNWSTFEKYHLYMLELAEKYSDRAQFAFKPHPILKSKLEKLWGEEKTKEYYSKWGTNRTTQLVEDSYEELFKGSDAMLHDCGSFTVEYLFVNKPVCRIMVETYVSNFSEFGNRCLDVHYKAFNEDDIEKFIINVINGTDELKKPREEFFEKYLNFLEELPSKKIIREIEKYTNKDTHPF